MVSHGLGRVATVASVVGTGTSGFSDREVNDPYGLVFGPDGALYFCDLGNQRVRRLDLSTGGMTTIVGNGERGYSGDGGPATDAALNMPHEVGFDAAGNLYVVERDSHAVRRIDMGTGVISTVAGNGQAGFEGDNGPASGAHLNIPHSIAFDVQGDLLICDIGNHRIRRVSMQSGTIDTYAGTGEREPTQDGSPLAGTPLNGPRTLVRGDDGDLFLALREGNAIYRIDGVSGSIRHLAGTGAQGYEGDGGPVRQATLAGPKGLAFGNGMLYVADTENHAIRAIDLATGTIDTVLGTGQRGDGPEPDPRACRLARPHGLCVGHDGALYVADSESHRIRVLR